MQRKVMTTRDLCETALFTVVTIVLCQISIPLPFTPVPISFGMIAIYMTGMILKPKNAVLAQITYLFLGAIGLPVFHNFTSGIGIIVGPTGGYLFVYPVVACFIALMVLLFKQIWPDRLDNTVFRLWIFGTLTVGLCTLYLSGAWWYSYIAMVPISASVALTVIPFIPMDIVKILICVFCVIPLRKRLIRQGLVE